jgi:hypothetical protein
LWRYGATVSTRPFQGRNTGSIPVSATNLIAIQQEIDGAAQFGQALEDLILAKGAITLRSNTSDRDKLLLAYWSLINDYDKGILELIRERLYGGAFALLRPVVEAQVRAHVVLMAPTKMLRESKTTRTP